MTAVLNKCVTWRLHFAPQIDKYVQELVTFETCLFKCGMNEEVYLFTRWGEYSGSDNERNGRYVEKKKLT
jgi:hypothetical protein